MLLGHLLLLLENHKVLQGSSLCWCQRKPTPSLAVKGSAESTDYPKPPITDPHGSAWEGFKTESWWFIPEKFLWNPDTVFLCTGSTPSEGRRRSQVTMLLNWNTSNGWWSLKMLWNLKERHTLPSIIQNYSIAEITQLWAQVQHSILCFRKKEHHLSVRTVPTSPYHQPWSYHSAGDAEGRGWMTYVSYS